jgi:hypothetical protein
MRDARRLGPDRWQIEGRAFAIGDEVVALHNDHHLGVRNGHRDTSRAATTTAST